MEFIDKILFINLDQRRDRFEQIINEFIRMGLTPDKVMRIVAIPFDPPAAGCSLSHIKALEYALEKGYQNIMILEDDFQFLMGREELDRALNYLFTEYNHEERWNVVKLSYNLSEEVDFHNDPFLGRVVYSGTSSGYLISREYIPTFLSKLKPSTHELISTRDESLFAIDTCWRSLQERDIWLYFRKRVGRQRVSHSDIVGGVVDYGC